MPDWVEDRIEEEVEELRALVDAAVALQRPDRLDRLCLVEQVTATGERGTGPCGIAVASHLGEQRH